jgi:hypothetical protein
MCVRARARVEEQLQQSWRHLWLLLLHRFHCRYPPQQQQQQQEE